MTSVSVGYLVNGLVIYPHFGAIAIWVGGVLGGGHSKYLKLQCCVCISRGANSQAWYLFRL